MIDAKSHRMRVYDNGKLVASFPQSMASRRWPTRTGTYTVLGKDARIRMTSCSARITCNPRSREYYDLQVRWAVRLTYSGIFVHAAPWDDRIGQVHASHGCIRLRTADAQWFYNFSRPGDVVVVHGTG